MKYKNDLGAKLDAELAELEAAQAAQNAQPETTPLDPPSNLGASNAEEETWKKRHSDLRSYTSKQINALQKEIEDLKKSLSQKQTDSRLPENKAELAEWVKQYPDLARVMMTLVDERAEQSVRPVAEEVQDARRQLEAERIAMARERAFNEILKVHPDFPELIEKQDFKDWVEAQPVQRGPRIGQALYDALYNNETDAQSAIQAVNVYKQDRPKAKGPDRDAAASVRRTSAASPSNNSGKRVFSESEVDRMKIWEYEKLEAEIDEAKREGRFTYDITGAAR